ncbi:MAG: hypothetical protein PHQ59_04640 [Candidatus Daviesbacteria bacterium]|nr:hypothetical protein [Candidatus Daviesbacteria bacterium]
MNFIFRVSDYIIKVFIALSHERLSLGKRHKIIIVSIVLSFGLLSTQLVPFYLTYRFIAGLALLAFALSIWALWEGLNSLKAIVLMILPTAFTLAVASYYFLLPVRWLTRFPVAIAFGLVFYTLLLSQNVFNVASIRTIPLYRVASTTVFVLTLITAYMLFNVVFSLNLFFIWNGVAVFLISFPLILQVIWSLDMEGLNSFILVWSAILALIVGEMALSLSFWPIAKPMSSLIISTGLYVTLGIATHTLKDRLNRVDVWQFLGWGLGVFLIAVLTTSWTG